MTRVKQVTKNRQNINITRGGEEDRKKHQTIKITSPYETKKGETENV